MNNTLSPGTSESSNQGRSPWRWLGGAAVIVVMLTLIVAGVAVRNCYLQWYGMTQLIDLYGAEPMVSVTLSTGDSRVTAADLTVAYNNCLYTVVGVSLEEVLDVKQGLYALEHLPFLHSITFNNTDLSDADAEAVASRLRLEKIHLNACRIESNVVRNLLRCESLKTIRIHNVSGAGDGLPEMIRRLRPDVSVELE